MKPVYVYPGSFCPPTYGHADIAKRTARLFKKTTVICSSNPDKEESWFSPEACKEMWQTYELCSGIAVRTLSESTERNSPITELVMVRGIRDDRDLDYEKDVVLFNCKNFGIVNYLYVISEERFKHISSTSARRAAERLDVLELGNQVSPLVVTSMLEKALNIRNLYMVVGKAGSGKSTFLKMLCEKNPENIFINTDDFTHRLRPLLEETFSNMDLVDIAINRSEELKEVIGKPWLELTKKALKSVPRNSNVFLEIPYGFQKDKMSFRFFGGKIIYVGCKNEKINQQRIIGRGTPQIVKFIDKIPDKKETLRIAKKHKLRVTCVDTSGSLEDLKKEVTRINKLTAVKEVHNV